MNANRTYGYKPTVITGLKRGSGYYRLPNGEILDTVKTPINTVFEGQYQHSIDTKHVYTDSSVHDDKKIDTVLLGVNVVGIIPDNDIEESDNFFEMYIGAETWQYELKNGKPINFRLIEDIDRKQHDDFWGL